jgi:hypothetical protein
LTKLGEGVVNGTPELAPWWGQSGVIRAPVTVRALQATVNEERCEGVFPDALGKGDVPFHI